MIGTGAFRLKSQNKQRAELVRFDNYWGGKPPLDGVVITFYTDPAPMVLALRAGQLDLVHADVTAAGARVQEQQQVPGLHRAGLVAQHVRHAGRSRPVPGRPRAPSGRAHAQPSGHHQPSAPRRRHARKRLAVLPAVPVDRPVDQAAQAEPRARARRSCRRRAGGPEVHDHDPEPVRRPGFRGRGPGLRPASGDRHRPRRHDVRRLLPAVGGGDYYATTPWLNAPATITEYGARGVPNLYITAAYMSNGIWNASKYANNDVRLAGAVVPRVGRPRGAAQGDEEDGGPPPPRHAGDHGVLPRLHGAASSSKVRELPADPISHIRVAKTSLA